MAFKAAEQRLKREHNDRAWQAWWTAAMPKMKKFPKLEKLLARELKRKPQTADQQWAIFSAMAEASKVARKN